MSEGFFFPTGFTILFLLAKWRIGKVFFFFSFHINEIPLRVRIFKTSPPTTTLILFEKEKEKITHTKKKKKKKNPRPDQPKPNHTQHTPEQNSHRRRQTKPHPTHKARRSHNNPPRILLQTGTTLKRTINKTNSPKAINSRIDEADSGGVDAAQTRGDPAATTQAAPETDGAGEEDEAREEDAQVADEGAECGVYGYGHLVGG
jgi:hypothetical protein